MSSLHRRAAVLAVSALVAVGCGSDNTSSSEFDLVTADTLTVCTDVPYAPFEFEDASAPTGYSGFDIELMEGVASALELDIAVVATGFEGLESGTTFAAGTCDIAASAMTITEERAQRLAFTDPYYVAMQSLLVPGDSDLSSIDDLTADMSVGVQSGTTGEAYAEAEIAEATIVAFENPGDLFVALESGQLDAILQDLPVNERFAQDNDATVVAEYDTDEEYGFAMAPDRSDGLVDAVNAALEDIRESGRYDELHEEYFLAG
ncbi:MAG: transporter substrate-binding domain-containing protein [Nitriliruptoraceae bacterium]